MSPDQGAYSSILKVWAADLGPLAEQLLLLQSQPLLLYLLQPHLVVAPQDSTVGAGRRQLPPLLHWSTLGDPLLVQGWKGDKKRVQIHTGQYFTYGTVFLKKMKKPVTVVESINSKYREAENITHLQH